MTEVTNKSLIWRQPSFWKRHYELRDGDTLLASLDQPSIWSSEAIGKGFDGGWRFKPLDFWNLDIGVSKERQELPFATLRQRVWKREALLELPKGKRLYLVRTFFEGTYSLLDERGVVLLQLKNKLALKYEAAVQVFTNQFDCPELPWLLILTWYVALIRRRRARRG
ncbi:MAG: hypothetical protein HY966_02240 [Ignavibacteriales bacterium]|nr:hypothetical protein [Ignavibacteriales bacterium]